MAVYKLQKNGKSAKGVVLRAESIEIHVPALITCVVVAFVIWLYIVNVNTPTVGILPEGTTPPPTSAETTGEAVPAEAMEGA